MSEPEIGLFAATDPDGTPGAVAPGELIESAWGNTVAKNIDALVSALARTQGPYVGAWPAGGYPDFSPQIRAGHVSTTTTSFGDCIATFSTPFPTGVAAVIVTPTNNAGGISWWASISTTLLTGFQMYAMAPQGSPFATGHPPSQPAVWTVVGNIQFDYIAIGM